jgi:TRAP transporter TAXI family solute receptor
MNKPDPGGGSRRRARLSRNQAANLARVRRTVLRGGGLINRYAVGIALGVAAIAAALVIGGPSITPEEEAQAQFFQISTASPGGTYFPIGRTLASIISQPPGSEPCRQGARCGVPGVIAVAKASPGSVANVRNVNSGRIESALVQADIAAWAFNGERMFDGEGYASNLRAIASLYPEAVQLVATRRAGIDSVADLRGKRVSIDRVGSGTRADAQLILKAYGIEESDLTVVEVDSLEASDMILRGALDAFFLLAGTPSLSVSDLMRRGEVTLVPIDGPPAEQLVKENSFFVPHVIADGVYPGVPRTATLSVRALWITHVAVSRKLVRRITQALWSPANRKTLDQGHPKALEVRIETALEGVPIPLHRGARDAYRELGVTLPE